LCEEQAEMDTMGKEGGTSNLQYDQFSMMAMLSVTFESQALIGHKAEVVLDFGRI
jgi:hypothetical protein